MFGFVRKERTIFVGDVHGCLDELRLLVDKLRINARDRVIMLGDLINRGPDSAGVVRFVVESGFECIMGNHEYDYIKNYPNIERYRVLREQLGDDLHAWIEQRPIILEEPDFIAVHAGIVPGLVPSETPIKLLMTIRTWDGEGRNLKSPANPPWYQFYTGSRPVIYGHWAGQGLKLRENTLGIDSGCVYGNQLTALVLENRKIVQVEARRTYVAVQKK